MGTTHAVESSQESTPLTKKEPSASRGKAVLIAIVSIAVAVFCVSFLRPLSSETVSPECSVSTLYQWIFRIRQQTLSSIPMAG